MTALDKLIEAVEAGAVSDWAFGSGYPRTVLGDKWEAGMNAYCGSLDAADTLMTILPEGAKWMRMSDGAFIVWLPGTPISASADATGNISRDLFLAILRAYRSVQG